MNLLKVNHRYLNLDHIYQITFNDTQREKHPELEIVAELDLIFPVSMYPDEETSAITEAAGMRLFGQDAEALRHHLQTNSKDILQTYQNHLQHQALSQKIHDWNTRFETFADQQNISPDYIQDKDGYSRVPRENYRYFLQGEDTPHHWKEPDEKTYAEFLQYKEAYHTKPL